MPSLQRHTQDLCKYFGNYFSCFSWNNFRARERGNCLTTTTPSGTIKTTNQKWGKIRPKGKFFPTFLSFFPLHRGIREGLGRKNGSRDWRLPFPVLSFKKDQRNRPHDPFPIWLSWPAHGSKRASCRPEAAKLTIWWYRLEINGLWSYISLIVSLI